MTERYAYGGQITECS